MGATPGKDGESAMSWPSNISSTPVEVAERNSLLLYHYRRLRSGSGGGGRFRGGLGQDVLIESESDTPVAVSFMAERTRVRAPGLAGGGPGGAGAVEINGRTVNHRLQHVLQRGDTVLLRLPGGGGYGPAAERDPRLVELDERPGYAEGGRASGPGGGEAAGPGSLEQTRAGAVFREGCDCGRSPRGVVSAMPATCLPSSSASC
jgi:N-methylhydantoinase B/oxoprolinase/acetone carboxylase alpha subunit